MKKAKRESMGAQKEGRGKEKNYIFVVQLEAGEELWLRYMV